MACICLELEIMRPLYGVLLRIWEEHESQGSQSVLGARGKRGLRRLLALVAKWPTCSEPRGTGQAKSGFQTTGSLERPVLYGRTPYSVPCTDYTAPHPLWKSTQQRAGSEIPPLTGSYLLAFFNPHVSRNISPSFPSSLSPLRLS